MHASHPDSSNLFDVLTTLALGSGRLVTAMIGGLCRVATCNLNQWAMDFEGNLRRIEASIGM